VNYEASSAELADKMPTRIGVMTRITSDSRINVANAGHLLLDFLLKGRSNDNKSWRSSGTSSPSSQNGCDIHGHSPRNYLLLHAKLLPQF